MMGFRTAMVLTAGIGSLLIGSPAGAVCAPPADQKGGLLILDVSGCDASSTARLCGNELKGFGVDDGSACPDGIAVSAPPAAMATKPVKRNSETLVLAGWAPAEPRGDDLLPGHDAPVQAYKVRSASTESDLGMWASLLAGLGIASMQMRRRRGMQVVSS